MNMLDDVEFQIAKLALGPDDVLVARINKPASSVIATEMRAQLERRTGHDLVLVVDSTVDLSVLSKTDAKKLGGGK